MDFLCEYFFNFFFSILINVKYNKRLTSDVTVLISIKYKSLKPYRKTSINSLKRNYLVIISPLCIYVALYTFCFNSKKKFASV